MQSGTFEIDRGVKTAVGLWRIAIGTGMLLGSYLLYLAAGNVEYFAEIIGGLTIGGFLFGGIGSIDLIYRSRIVFDKTQRTAVDSWGLFKCFRHKSVALDGYDRVTIEYVTARGRNRMHEFYNVALAGPDESYALKTFFDYPEARELAECFAEYVELPLEDNAAGKTYTEDGEASTLRGHETVDASIRAQWKASRADLPFPMPPDNNRIKVQRIANEYVFDLPARTGHLWVVLSLVAIAFLGAAGSAWYIEYRLGDERDIIYFFGFMIPAGLILAGAMGLYYGVDRTSFHERITVGRTRLRHDVSLRWSHHARESAPDDVEEFGYTRAAARFAAKLGSHDAPDTLPLPAILARTDYETIWMGVDLTRAEQVWLHDILQYLIVQASDSR